MTSTRGRRDGDAEVMTTHVTSSMRRARGDDGWDVFVVAHGDEAESEDDGRNGNGNDGDTDEWVN